MRPCGSQRACSGALLTVKGERHSITTFVQILLEHFFLSSVRRIHSFHWYESCVAPGARIIDCCSKHGLPSSGCDYAERPPIFVFLLRDPYLWLRSMYDEPYSQCNHTSKPASFSDFLRQPFALYGRCHPSRVRQTPMHVWSEHAVAYRKLRWAKKIILRDRDVLSEQHLAFAMQRLGEMLHLPRDRDYTLPSVLPPVKSASDNWTRASYARQRRKFLIGSHSLRLHYSDADLVWVNRYLPDAAMAGLFERKTSNPKTAAHRIASFVNAGVPWNWRRWRRRQHEMHQITGTSLVGTRHQAPRHQDARHPTSPPRDQTGPAT